MFEDNAMQRELNTVSYRRLSKYIYRASWSTREVEHFLYFEKDSHKYFVAWFGLRNDIVEEFSIASAVRYQHENFQLTLKGRDPSTACSMKFVFGSLDEFSQNPWPRVHLSNISGHDLAILVSGFVRQSLIPSIGSIVDLQAYLAFLLADQEPNRWPTTNNHMIRVAQIVAVAAQLGRSSSEIKELLRPYDHQIEQRMRWIANHTVTGIDMYVDRLLSDWASQA